MLWHRKVEFLADSWGLHLLLTHAELEFLNSLELFDFVSFDLARVGDFL